jgi:hypothetical protein
MSNRYFVAKTLQLTRQRNDANENFDRPQYVSLTAKKVDIVIEILAIRSTFIHHFKDKLPFKCVKYTVC